MKGLNKLKLRPEGTRGTLPFAKARRVHHTRKQGASVAGLRGERIAFGKRWDTWRFVIGWLDFYLLNNLDSIISLQIILFYFYQNL